MHLGLDCSTQSLSAIIIDAKAGQIVYEASVNYEKDLPHYQTSHGFVRGTEPDEFFSNPLMWIEALDLLFTRMQQDGAPLSSITAISGSAQQHATVYVNQQFDRALESLSPNIPLEEQFNDVFTRPVSPIWMDASTKEDCKKIAKSLGGNRKATKRSGSRITQRFSAAQIHKYSRQFPERWEETDTVHLLSSFLASILAGTPAGIDYGDGAGMNLMHINKCKWDKKLTKSTAANLFERLPKLTSTLDIVGTISPYFSSKFGLHESVKCAHWSGDNPCSLVGMGVIRPGTWIISLGTSYTLFSAIDTPFPDPQDFGHVFGNPVGNYMSLSCFKNGALACVQLKKDRGFSWEEFERQLRAPRTPDSPISLPFYESEITPRVGVADLSDATACSLVDGQILNMRLHSLWHGHRPDTILVTGGISASDGVCQTIANIFQRPVQRLETSSSAALGAALIAATADGHNIDTLSEQFCSPSEGATLEPDPSTERTYQILATKFSEKLYAHKKRG